MPFGLTKKLRRRNSSVPDPTASSDVGSGTSISANDGNSGTSKPTKSLPQDGDVSKSNRFGGRRLRTLQRLRSIGNGGGSSNGGIGLGRNGGTNDIKNDPSCGIGGTTGSVDGGSGTTATSSKGSSSTQRCTDDEDHNEFDQPKKDTTPRKMKKKKNKKMKGKVNVKKTNSNNRTTKKKQRGIQKQASNGYTDNENESERRNERHWSDCVDDTDWSDVGDGDSMNDYDVDDDDDSASYSESDGSWSSSSSSSSSKNKSRRYKRSSSKRSSFRSYSPHSSKSWATSDQDGSRKRTGKARRRNDTDRYPPTSSAEIASTDVQQQKYRRQLSSTRQNESSSSSDDSSDDHSIMLEDLKGNNNASASIRYDDKSHVQMMLQKLQQESMELERRDVDRQKRKDPETQRIQQMIGQVHQQTHAVDSRLKRRGSRAKMEESDSDSDSDQTSTSNDDEIPLNGECQTRDERYNSSYESFQRPSAATRMPMEPTFQPKKGPSPVGLSIKDASKDPNVRHQLNILADKMKEIGIDPIQIGLSVDNDTTPRPSTSSSAAFPLESANVPDASDQMALAKKLALDRLQSQLQQKEFERSAHGSFRSRRSDRSLRSRSRRSSNDEHNDDPGQQKQGKALHLVGRRANEGDWLFEQLSLRSGRTNKSTPSTTNNVGLFIDSPFSSRGIFSDNAGTMPTTDISGYCVNVDDYQDDDWSCSSGSSWPSHSSSSSSDYDDIPLPTERSNQIQQATGLRTITGNRTSYKSLTEFVEEHEADCNTDDRNRPQTPKSLASNRHSFKSLIDYDDEKELKDKVFSQGRPNQVADRVDCAIVAPTKSPYMVTPSRRSYKSLTQMIEEHEVPELPLPIHSSTTEHKATEYVPSTISVSITSPGVNDSLEEESISELCSPSVCLGSTSSQSQTRRSMDPPEMLQSNKLVSRADGKRKPQNQTIQMLSSTVVPLERKLEEVPGGQGMSLSAEKYKNEAEVDGNTKGTVGNRSKNLCEESSRTMRIHHQSSRSLSKSKSQRRSKSRSKSPTKASSHNRNDRLEKLASQKKEKEKALRKLYRKSSSIRSSSRYDHKEAKSKSKGLSSSERPGSKYTKADSSMRSSLRSFGDDSASSRDGLRPDNEKEKSSRKSRSRGSDSGKEKPRSRSGSRDVSCQKSQRDPTISHGSSNRSLHSRSLRDSTRTSLHSRGSQDKLSSNRRGRSKEQKIRKTDHSFDLESLATSTKRRKDKGEKEKKKKKKKKKSKSRSKSRSRSKHDRKNDDRDRRKSTKSLGKLDDDDKKKKKEKKKKKKQEKETRNTNTSHEFTITLLDMSKKTSSKERDKSTRRRSTMRL